MTEDGEAGAALLEPAAASAQAPESDKDPIAVSYSVHVKHGWDGQLEIEVKDAGQDEASRKSIAWSLRQAAEMLEAGASHCSNKADTPNVIAIRGGVFDNTKTSEPDAGLVKALAKTFAMAREGKLSAYRHEGFWQAMDTLRDKNYLEDLWAAGNAPWKRWA